MNHLEYMEVELPVSKLEVGMHVVALDRPWNETSFLMQGFVVSSDQELFSLQKQCNYVVVQVKTALGKNLQRASAVEMAKFHLAQRNRIAIKSSTTETSNLRKQYHHNQMDFSQGVTNSVVTFESARKLASKIMNSVKVGRELNIKECRVAVARVVDSVLKNANALRFLTQIKHINLYTVEHCMNCCVIAAAFGRHLGLSVHDIEQLAMSALLHDIGKAKISIKILNKKEKLTRDEAIIMAKHTETGWGLLMSLPDKNVLIAEVAYGHHEREDGLGYPRHLHNNEISLFTKIVTLVDCYDAMTSRRCYGTVHTNSDALDIIRENSGSQFDTGLANEFVKCIGEYPPGCLVEMTNGEIGIVISSRDEYGVYPRVLLVRDQQHHELINNRIVDTRLGDLDSYNIAYEVLSEVPNGSYGVKLENYLTMMTQSQQSSNAIG